MKIGIYSICKNEESNFENWYNNVKDADRTFVLDTGSTDSTLKLLQAKMDLARTGEIKEFSFNYLGDRPFAFDTARNMALDALLWSSYEELDYVVWVDFDETFPEGWFADLKNALIACEQQGTAPNSMQFNNRFEGSESSWYQSRVHRPRQYRWKYCAHEVLMPCVELEQEVIGSCDITISHPDKELRNDYTALLLESHEQNNDGRSAYYLGREYYYNLKLEQASKYLRECLFTHNGWQAERGEAAKMLSRIHDKDDVFALKYLHFYLAYCNLQREPYIELVRYYYERENWDAVLMYANMALAIEKPSNYLTLDDSCYTYAPHDFMSIAYDRLGDKQKAAYHAAICLQMKPTETRFQENVQYFIEAGVLKIEIDSEKAED